MIEAPPLSTMTCVMRDEIVVTEIGFPLTMIERRNLVKEAEFQAMVPKILSGSKRAVAQI